MVTKTERKFEQRCDDIELQCKQVRRRMNVYVGCIVIMFIALLVLGLTNIYATSMHDAPRGLIEIPAR